MDWNSDDGSFGGRDHMVGLEGNEMMFKLIVIFTIQSFRMSIIGWEDTATKEYTGRETKTFELGVYKSSSTCVRVGLEMVADLSKKLSDSRQDVNGIYTCYAVDEK